MRRAIGLVAAALVVCVTVIVAVPGSASAGFENLTVKITKVVVGNPPSGASFLVQIQCNGTLQAEANFDAAGGMETVMFDSDEEDCSVSEPENGSADSTAFACEAVSNVTCDTSTFEIETSPSEVNLTVTNTFVPPAAAPVPAAPTFTG